MTVTFQNHNDCFVWLFLQFGIVWFCLDANHHKEKMEQWKHWKMFCFSLWCFLSLEYAILYVTFFTDDQLNIHVAISRERKELSYLKFNSFLNPGIWGDFFLDFSVIFVWTSENIEFHIFLVSWFFSDFLDFSACGILQIGSSHHHHHHQIMIIKLAAPVVKFAHFPPIPR